MESQWRALRREMTRSYLHFRKIVWVGQPEEGQARVRGMCNSPDHLLSREKEHLNGIQNNSRPPKKYQNSCQETYLIFNFSGHWPPQSLCQTFWAHEVQEESSKSVKVPHNGRQWYHHHLPPASWHGAVYATQNGINEIWFHKNWI